MKCLDDCHHYVLSNFEEKATVQEIKFIKKQTVNKVEPTVLETVHDGTTNEEVLKVLIHRCKKLNEKLPSRQTSIAITKLEEALMWFEHRTAERKERNVEGTHAR